MREYFLDWPGDFEFKGALAAGWGQTSVIVAVMERSPNPAIRKPRGFIVKRSYQEAVFNPEHDEILQREIDAVYVSALADTILISNSGLPSCLSP